MRGYKKNVLRGDGWNNPHSHEQGWEDEMKIKELKELDGDLPIYVQLEAETDGEARTLASFQQLLAEMTLEQICTLITHYQWGMLEYTQGP
jgi:hypothetical protein